MKRRRLFFILLIFLVSFLLPLACAYSGYDVIVEADFLTNGVKYEAADIGDLLLDKQNILGMIPDPFSLLFFVTDDFSGPSSQVSFPRVITDQFYSLLRC